MRLPPAGVARHIALVRSGEEHRRRRVKSARADLTTDECTCAHSKARENESSLIIYYSFHVIAHRGCSLYHKRIFPVFMWRIKAVRTGFYKKLCSVVQDRSAIFAMKHLSLL